jgi:hypothetical protein
MNAVLQQPAVKIPSKPLTLDLVKILDFVSRCVCYHQNAPYRKMKKMKGKNFLIANSVLFIFGT